ncbi:MAG: hypothetical protein HY808_08805 [Nitrospirae bacterium]|nr:hypothetical protein [Nitrospirota bacterium]
MNIDARSMTSQELFKKLKELFALQCGAALFIEVQVNTLEDSKRIKSFASMSGCKTEIENKGDHFIARVSGIPCCA